MAGTVTDFFVHTVSVETLTGTGANGPVYAAPATVACYLDGKTQLVRAATGEQVVSAAQVYCSVADGAKFTPDSRVTANGRKTQVIGVNTLDLAGAPDMAGAEHTLIYLK